METKEKNQSCAIMSPMERVIRRLAGTMITLSVILGYFVSPWWFLLTVFVGLNLLQSSFTNWCLAEDILAKFGVNRN
jgi:hypothetical protein